MKQSKSGLVLSIIQIVLGFFMSFGVKFIFHACTAMEDSSKPCVDAQNAIFALGIAILVMAVLQLIFRKPGERAGLFAGMTICAIMAVILPKNLISLCMMPDMHCLSVMYPAVIAFGIITIVISVISVIVNKRKGN